MAKKFIQSILQKGKGKQHKTKGDELEGDPAMHLQGWTTKPIKVSSKAKWSKEKGTKEVRPKDVSVIYQQRENTQRKNNNHEA